MTHRDGLSDLSAGRQRRRDAIHHKTRVTTSERPPYRSFWGRFGVRQRTLTVKDTACGSLPTRTFPKMILMSHYQRSSVLGPARSHEFKD